MSISGSFPLRVALVSADLDNTQVRQAWKSLANSLAAGDLDSARSSFALLQEFRMLPASSQNAGQTQLEPGINELAGALASGNLSSARAAFSTLLTTITDSRIRPSLSSRDAQLRISADRRQSFSSDAAVNCGATANGKASPLEQFIEDLLRDWNLTSNVDVNA